MKTIGADLYFHNFLTPKPAFQLKYAWGKTPVGDVSPTEEAKGSLPSFSKAGGGNNVRE